MFSSQGEYEPITFSLYGLKDQTVNIKVNDMVSKSGDKIAVENIDVRVVTSLRKMVNKEEKKFNYSPFILDGLSKVTITSGSSSQFWLTVYIPPDTKAGVYKCDIDLVGTKKSTVKLLIRVLPFKLDVIKDISLYMYEVQKSFGPIELYFADCIEHGMNSIQMDTNVSSAGNATKYFSDFFKKYAEAGFARNNPMISSYYGSIARWDQQKNWTVYNPQAQKGTKNILG